MTGWPGFLPPRETEGGRLTRGVWGRILGESERRLSCTSAGTCRPRVAARPPSKPWGGGTLGWRWASCVWRPSSHRGQAAEAPDGKRIAVINYFGDDRPLYAMNADGSGRIALGDSPYPWTYSWAPDGSRITQGGYSDAKEGIVVTNADGSGQRFLTQNTAGRDLGPTWSPDGTKIAFMRARDEKSSFHIYVMNADGGGVRKLMGKGANVLPAWSPDGKKIAFLGGRRKTWALRVMNADGTAQRKLAVGRAPRPSGGQGLAPTVPDTSSPLMMMAAAPSDLLNDEPVWRPARNDP